MKKIFIFRINDHGGWRWWPGISETKGKGVFFYVLILDDQGPVRQSRLSSLDVFTHIEPNIKRLSGSKVFSQTKTGFCSLVRSNYIHFF